MSAPRLHTQRSMQVMDNGDIVDCSRLPHTARNSLYKTELCKHFMDTGNCRYGTKCQFAHGETELRGVLRHPKYKTTLCKVFASEGACSYGDRCRFIHEKTDANPSEEIIVQSATLTPLGKPRVAPVLMHRRSSSGIDFSAFQASKLQDYNFTSATEESVVPTLADLDLTKLTELMEDKMETMSLDEEIFEEEPPSLPRGRRLSFFKRIWNTAEVAESN